MTTDDHPRARAGSSKGSARPPPEPSPRWVDALECDVGALEEAHVEVIEALARLQLAARRAGRWVVLRDANPDLRDLLRFVGLEDALPCIDLSGVEPGWQTEQREQAGRVEEEADAGDQPA